MKKTFCICGSSKKMRINKKSHSNQTEATDFKSMKAKNMDSFDQKKNEQNTRSHEITPRRDLDPKIKESLSETHQINKAQTGCKMDENLSVKEFNQPKTEFIVSNNKDKAPELNNNGPFNRKAIESNIAVNLNETKREKEEARQRIEKNPSICETKVEKEEDEKEEDENEKWLIPQDSKLICPHEIGVIEFSPNGLGRFLESLDNLAYAPLYNKNHLEITIRREGSPLNSKFYLFRSIYTQKKSELGENANIPNIVRLMYRIEDRVKWDPTLKLLKKYEGDENVFVVRTWCHSLVFFISEREGLEKRMMFRYKGVPIVLSTPVRDDYIPDEKGVVRITNYLNAIKFEEDDENFYFICYNQHDFKMPIPQWILNFTLPNTTCNWFVDFQKTALKTDLDPLTFDY